MKVEDPMVEEGLNVMNVTEKIADTVPRFMVLSHAFLLYGSRFVILDQYWIAIQHRRRRTKNLRLLYFLFFSHRVEHDINSPD